MNQLNYIDFEMDGQEVRIEFNDPHWSDNEDNFRACIGETDAKYKNDLID